MTSHASFSNDGATQLAQKIEAQPGPPRLLPGGGKRLKGFDGREVVIGGEALRNALRQYRIRKPTAGGGIASTVAAGHGPEFSRGYSADGKEVVIDVSLLQVWLARGATDLGPVWRIVGEEPLRIERGPSIADQKSEAGASLRHREHPIHFLE